MTDGRGEGVEGGQNIVPSVKNIWVGQFTPEITPMSMMVGTG